MSMLEKKEMIKLRSSDDEVIEVEKDVMLQSQAITHMIEDNCTDGVIPIANITGNILRKIIEYCKKHSAVKSDPKLELLEIEPKPDLESKPKSNHNDSSIDDELKDWDEKFMNENKDQNGQTGEKVLYQLLNGANYLAIRSLLDLISKTVADMMREKTPQEIRERFNIKNDFTPEEEEAFKKENERFFK